MNRPPQPVSSDGSSPLLRELGEDQVLTSLLRHIQPPPDQPGLTGPGDDCAVIPLPGTMQDWLLTTDPVIEGVHFLADTEPALIGRKAVGRAISDIAAMGGAPQWLLINITAPADIPLARLQQVYSGADDMAATHRAIIIGGDIGTGKDFALHVFAIGHIPHGTAILRSGAKAGDALFVTGELGGSWLGKHLSFTPRVAEGTWLREHGWATAMMDISDGIGTDLRRLLRASQAGADLTEATIPISEAATRMPDKKSPLHHALTDGEDFELLFTVPADRRAAFLTAWHDAFDLPCTQIGTITDQPERLRTIPHTGTPRDWDETGYVHFRTPGSGT